MKVEAVRLATLETYQQHAKELSRRGVALTRNTVLAQDVLQETFLRFFLAKMNDEKIVDERAWLMRVTLSLIRDWKRSANTLAFVSLQDAESTVTEAKEARDTGNPGTPWLPSAAQGLAPRELECLKLRAQGFDYREIAGSMRIRIGTVGVLLNRAIRKIRLRTP